MVREKFTFYSNRINAGKSLPDKERLEFYDKLLNYAGFGIETPSEGIIETMFGLIKPLIDDNNERFINGQLGADHGAKGGRGHKKKPIGDGEVNPTTEKIKFLDRVFLTQQEYDGLVYDFGRTVVDDRIEDLDAYISNGKGEKYKDHNKTLRVWFKKDGLKKKTHPVQTEAPQTDPFFNDLLTDIGASQA